MFYVSFGLDFDRKVPMLSLTGLLSNLEHLKLNPGALLFCIRNSISDRAFSLIFSFSATTVHT